MSRGGAVQYSPGNSLIHRLDARIKLSGLFLLFIAVVLSSTSLSRAIILCAAAAAARLSGLPIKAALYSIGRLWLFFLTIFLMNALFFDPRFPLWSWGILHISEEGILQGARVVFHVALIIILCGVFMRTTSPTDTAAALASLLGPLKLIKVPTEDAAMIIGTALRFIPALFEEADTIKKAQTARGAKFESKKSLEKAASFLPLVIPIFLAAFQRADELAAAMEARGYKNAKNRTKREKRPLNRIDLIALTVLSGLCLIQLYLFLSSPS